MIAIGFSSWENLRLALESGAVPIDIAEAPVGLVHADGSRIQFALSRPLGKPALDRLRRIGAEVIENISNESSSEELHNWAQALPLVRQELDASPSETVLFQLASASSLPQFLAECRRLNSEIVAWKLTEAGRAMVWVNRASLFSLTRQMDDAQAFVEQSPGVWVQHGMRHPLTKPAAPKKGRGFLLRPERDWTMFDMDQPHRAAPRYRISAAPTASESDSHPIAIPVAPRLVTNRRAGVACLWELHTDAIAHLRAWAAHADERLLHRLSIGVASSRDQTKLVLLANDRSDTAPIIVANADAYQSYLQLANLFVPVGQSLQPQLRRDLARRTYAADPNVLVMLTNGSNGLQATQLSRSAFRPLFDFIRYRVNEARQWVKSDSSPIGNVEAFEIVDRPSSMRLRSKPPPGLAKARPAESRANIWQTLVSWARGAWQATSSTDVKSTSQPARDIQSVPPFRATETERRLKPSDVRSSPIVAEKVLKSLRDDNAKTLESLWPQLAAAYESDAKFSDAALCWLHVLWHSPNRADASNAWHRIEDRACGGYRDLNHVVEAAKSTAIPAIIRLLASAVSSSDVLVHSSNKSAICSSASQLLQVHEEWLPVRSAWLAALAIYRQNRDELALARTRDRLLERMNAAGLNIDLDVPAFLRFHGARNESRVEAIRRWLTNAGDLLRRWLVDRPSGLATEQYLASERLERFGLARERRFTPAYVELMLAWALARSGQPDLASELMASARQRLPLSVATHAWLVRAFELRVAQATSDRAATVDWPANLKLQLDKLPFDVRYAIDRLRHSSRILEPIEYVDAYAVARSPADARPALADAADAQELLHQVESLWSRARPTPASRMQVLGPALAFAPRGGADYTATMLDRLCAEAQRSPPHLEFRKLLGVALDAACAFGFDERVRKLVALAEPELQTPEAEGSPPAAALAAVIAALYRLPGDDLLAFLNRVGPALVYRLAHNRRPAALRCRLALAGGWLAVDREDPALAALDEARSILFSPSDDTEKAAVALNYIRALEFGPIRLTLGRIDELLQRWPAPSDSFSSNAYYALSPLRVVETILRVLVNDDFSQSPILRRWLLDDELRIRRRIQNDIDEIVGSQPSREP